jgi:hypothetical protein
MVLFILLMLIVYSSAQEKEGIKTPFSETLMQIREHRIQNMKKQHEDNMRLYDELYLIRAKKHKEWLDLMEKENNKDKG